MTYCPGMSVFRRGERLVVPCNVAVLPAGLLTIRHAVAVGVPRSEGWRTVDALSFTADPETTRRSWPAPVSSRLPFTVNRTLLVTVPL